MARLFKRRHSTLPPKQEIGDSSQQGIHGGPQQTEKRSLLGLKPRTLENRVSWILKEEWSSLDGTLNNENADAKEQEELIPSYKQDVDAWQEQLTKSCKNGNKARVRNFCLRDLFTTSLTTSGSLAVKTHSWPPSPTIGWGS